MNVEVVVTINEIEKELIKAAKELRKTEPLSESILDWQILSKKSFGEMLAATLAQLLGGELIQKNDLERLFLTQFQKHPSILINAAYDLEATVERDPACSDYLEPLLFLKDFKGFRLIVRPILFGMKKERSLQKCSRVLLVKNLEWTYTPLLKLDAAFFLTTPPILSLVKRLKLAIMSPFSMA